jgi:hypothetical protein
MSTFSNEQHSLMKEKLAQAIKDFSYRLKRYDVNYSVALGYVPDNIDLSPLSKHIRETDRFIILDHHTCAVILDCTNEECGIKAANNLLTHFQGSFFSTPLYTCVVTASNFDSIALMNQELFYLLDYAIEHNMTSILLERSQVVEKH